MAIGNVDAIQLPNTKNVRVYYQTEDKMIRETCYDSPGGWFVGKKPIIATNAKAKSPITATCWITDKNVQVSLPFKSLLGSRSSPPTKLIHDQIRVYFLNEKNEICEVGVVSFCKKNDRRFRVADDDDLSSLWVSTPPHSAPSGYPEVL